MTLYKDNPNLGIKTVVTSNGDKEYRCNCQKIKGEYHLRGRDCHLIGDMWYRVKSGLIVKDHEKNVWVLKSDADKTLATGVVAFDENREAIIGYYTPNKYNNCVLIMGVKTIECISPDVAIQGGYAEEFSTGYFYKVKDPASIQKIGNKLDHTGKGYNLEDNVNEYAEKVKLFSDYDMPMSSKGMRSYEKMLGDVTFGIEIECEKGYIPNFIQNRLGVVVCRDGSLNDENGKPGPEFVTIPLKGAKGLQTILELSKELSKRTSIGIKCSLHIHIGNLPTTRIYLVSLFKLANKIQNELFTMFPFYKTDPEGIKQKNYNQKLPALGMYSAEESMNKKEFDEYVNNNYKTLFTWLSENYRPDRNCNRKNKAHPVTHKWGRNKRYYWLNFMNTIFSDRNTVEFRLHTPTTNAQKILNWLFICVAIVKYTSANTRNILLSKNNITLNEVLSYYNQFGDKGEFLQRYLNAYISERKEAFFKDFMKGDKTSEWEMLQDKQYKFQFEGVDYLF